MLICFPVSLIILAVTLYLQETPEDLTRTLTKYLITRILSSTVTRKIAIHRSGMNRLCLVDDNWSRVISSARHNTSGIDLNGRRGYDNSVPRYFRLLIRNHLAKCSYVR